MRRLATACAALVVAAALLACAGPASASTSQESQLQDDPLLVYRSPAQVAATLDELKALGVDRIRVTVLWRLVAPDPASQAKPAGFDGSNPEAYPGGTWNRYDAIVRLAAERGIAVHFNPTAPAPSWATGNPARADLEETDEPSPAEFGAFVTAVARRYDGTYDPCAADRYCDPFALPGGGTNRGALPRVAFWSLWNEPNQAAWLSPQNDTTRAVAARIYRGLLAAGWNALNATGHTPKRDTILFGELAPKGQSGAGVSDNVKPLAFLRALYCVDTKFKPLRGGAATALGCPTSNQKSAFRAANPALFAASGLAHHPYALLEPPARVSSDKDFAVLADTPRLLKTLDGAVRAYGKKRKLGVWLTEYGYQTKPPDPFGVPPSTQAAYLNEAEYMAYRSSRIRSWSQFLLVDDGPITSEPVGSPRYWGTFQTGLIGLDGRHKPAYDAYRLPIFVPSPRSRSGRFSVWGGVRPASNGKKQRVTLQYRRRGSGAFAKLRTVTTKNARGYVQTKVKLRASGQLRLSWNGSTSRVVSVTVKR
jgi:hypothetical protein